MNLVPIFVSESPDENEGLWAVRHGEAPDEFEQMFDQWNDVEYLTNFLYENIEDLTDERFQDAEMLVLNAVEEIMDEAYDLEQKLRELVNGGFQNNGQNLQQLFKPLDNRVYELKPLQKSKGSIKDRKWKDPKLRIYAIRMAPNLYIVTGGAIKLVDKMNDRQHLVEELKKIEKVREWLREEGINEPEDLNN